MFVAELDRPWLETPFLFQGFAVRDQSELAQLRALCRHVYIDDARTDPAVRSRLVQSPPAAPLLRERPQSEPLRVVRDVFGPELVRAKRVREAAKRFVFVSMDDVRFGRSFSTESAREVVSDLVESVSASASAALWLTNLKRKDEYTSLHCLNVCVLSIVFAYHLGLPREQVERIGLGALLHDLGKTLTPDAILNKPGPLTPEEFAVMRRHPVDGWRLVKEAGGGVPAESLEIIRHHHERIDGLGYPDGLVGSRIPLHVTVAAIADVYDALTSDRVYHSAVSPSVALKTLHEIAPRAFGKELMGEFIRCIGIYPTGCLVRLDDDSLAVVVSNDPRRRLKPVVMLVRDPQGTPLLPRPLVDLSLMSERHGWNRWTIKEAVDAAQYGIDLNEIVIAESAAKSL